MQIPCQVTRSEKGIFFRANEWDLKNIGKQIANSVLSRYWKGTEANNCNVVIEVEQIDE